MGETLRSDYLGPEGGEELGAYNLSALGKDDRTGAILVDRPAPIVQRPRTPPFQGGNGDSNSPGGTLGAW